MDKTNLQYENYHNHSHYSNIMTTDSSVTKEAYAKRAVELNQKVLVSGEHGWQGYYYETYELCKKYNLKFIVSTEAYWVKDRLTDDRTNAHIVLMAKNENGRRAINRILSEANETGYYYKPRIDLPLLLSLPADDIVMTTACVAFWQYSDIEEIIKVLHNHFKGNLYLEVQPHQTESQKALNRRILRISKEQGIDIILGCDSHYVYPEQSSERDDLLQSKGIFYESEDGWLMDYPDPQTLYNRMMLQGILSEEEILRAMENTLITHNFEDIELNTDIKLPTLFPDKTQEEKDKFFENFIWKLWEKEKEIINETLHSHYIGEIKKELQAIIDSHMADYFLIDYAIVKTGVENGGVITPTGRGSAVSFYINKLLGLTNVDRISAEVHMYPERFMTASRILKSGSLPDIDLNLSDPSIFAEAQKKILGEGHSYPMIAFGTLGKKSAFKMYARAKNLDINIANEISKQLEKFEKALHYAEDDEKDLVLLSDYIDEEYLPYIEDSEPYLGIVSDKKQAPCGYLIYQGNIREEIGLIKCKSETTGKEAITTVIDGLIAEKYHFLKNDLLTVTVVKLNDAVYKRIGIEPLSVKELIEKTKGDEKTWSIYEKGLTMCVNQVESKSTTDKVIRYKPKNISELTAFIAGIRPSFKSMYHIFEKREPFSYGVKVFDNILQTEELPYSFVLYQEQIMATLAYAGFPADETYTILKAISKKRTEKIMGIKNRFIDEFKKKIVETEPYLNLELIQENAEKVWKIIEDSASYGFNASHAYCVSCDSLNSAYLKAHYPYEFYETALNIFTEKKKKEKVSALIQEMYNGFGIRLGEYKWGNDNRGLVADKENHKINPSLMSVKYLNQAIANELYTLSKTKQFNTFTDLLVELLENTSLTKTHITILILLDYFSQFGGSGKLFTLYNEFYQGKNKYDKKYVEKTKVKRLQALYEIENNLENTILPLKFTIQAEIKYLGYVQSIYPSLNPNIVAVTDIMDKYTHPVLTLTRLSDGKTIEIKIKRDVFDLSPLVVGDIIELVEVTEQKKYKYINGKSVRTDEVELLLKRYDVYK